MNPRAAAPVPPQQGAEPSDEQLKEVFYAHIGHAWNFTAPQIRYARAIVKLTQECAALPVTPQQGAEPSEPAGWRWKYGDTEHHVWIVSDVHPHAAKVFRLEPLYAALPVTRSAPAADDVKASRHCHECMVNVTGPCQYKGCPVGVDSSRGGER